MSTFEEKKAEAEKKMQRQNPSVSPRKTPGERVRIPMTLPVPKLAVPEIPGYHTHWFRGSQARLQQAQNAGFEFVDPQEVDVNNLDLGGDASRDGNTDMGSRVSITAGDTDERGNAVRMYLMKQKMEYYLEDRQLLQNRNDSIADALTAAYRGGVVGGLDSGEKREDAALRYVDPKRTRMPDLFRRKK